MEFSESSEQEIEIVAPVPPHRCYPFDENVFEEIKEASLPLISLVQQDNFVKPFKRQFPDEMYETDDDIYFNCPPQVDKEIYLMNKVGIGKEEKQNEKGSMRILCDLIKSKDAKMLANTWTINEQFADEIYGCFKPFSTEINSIEENEELNEVESNRIERKNTGIMSLNEIPGELDDVFNDYNIPSRKKEEIKERFDDVLEALIIQVKEGGWENEHKITTFKSWAKKSGVDTQSITLGCKKAHHLIKKFNKIPNIDKKPKLPNEIKKKFNSFSEIDSSDVDIESSCDSHPSVDTNTQPFEEPTVSEPTVSVPTAPTIDQHPIITPPPVVQPEPVLTPPPLEQVPPETTNPFNIFQLNTQRKETKLQKRR